MPGPPLSGTTHQSTLTLEWSKGNRAGESRLFNSVYRELHRVAGRYMLGERSDHSLQPTDLVHEAYLRLIDQNRINWESRSHFFAIAAQLMRRILIDHARARNAEKRPKPGLKVPLSDLPIGIECQTTELLALDEALDRLEALDPRQARIVEMRFIAGLSEEEIAQALGVSVRTVKRDWRVARAWLYGELGREPHVTRALGAH